jgi:Ohr subfamily peroxiredoxin
MIVPVKTLVTATAVATGGRNGHSETTDKSVSVNLSVPKAMGGPGKPDTTTPEHLFAAGYAACFGGAVDFVAKSHKKDATKAKVSCAVGVGPREAGGFGLVVDLKVEDMSLPKAELEAFVREAHEKICPYSHATRDNVAVSLTVVGA